MNEFGNTLSNEHERRHDAVAVLVDRVTEILMLHPDTQTLDIRELNGTNNLKNFSDREALMRMSAETQISELAKFYKAINPDCGDVAIVDGMYSVLPPYEMETGEQVVLSTTILALPDERAIQTVGIAIRDDYVMSASTIHRYDDGQFAAMSSVRPRQNPLMTQALEIVGVAKSDIIVPLFSGRIHPTELEENLAALRTIVAAKYDEDQTDRFIDNVRDYYNQRIQSRSTAQNLGTTQMSSEDMDELLMRLLPMPRWA